MNVLISVVTIAR